MNIKYNNFISFEGIDGSGKSTQIKLLSKILFNNGIKNHIIREPGGTEISEMIRTILLNGKNKINPEEETLLFLSSRANLVNEFILPKLKDNFIILCDRYIDSTVAYQSYGRGMNLDLINEMNAFATNNCIPILTIVFDIDPLIVNERLNNKELDRMENEGIEFQNKVRQGYLEIAKIDDRFHIIDCNKKNIEEIHLELMKIISLYIKRICT